MNKYLSTNLFISFSDLLVPNLRSSSSSTIPGARFSKVPIINVYIQCRGLKSFEDNMIKLSVNWTKCNGLLAQTGASVPGIWFKYLIVTVNFAKQAADRIRILQFFCFWGELKIGVPGESKYHDQEQTQAT